MAFARHTKGRQLNSPSPIGKTMYTLSLPSLHGLQLPFFCDAENMAGDANKNSKYAEGDIYHERIRGGKLRLQKVE